MINKNPLSRNLLGYFKSMRWYYSFVALSAGLLGITFSNNNASLFKKISVLSVLFVGWGINQVINDYFGQEEDAINAPRRPLISGELEKIFAVRLTILLASCGLIASYFLNRWAIVFGLLFFFLNFAYEKTKKIPIFSNIVFGLLIANCVHYSSACVSGKGIFETIMDTRIFVFWLAVWAANFVLCFFADFKDFEGDKKTGEKTLVVLLGPEKARLFGPLLILVPFIVIYYLKNMFPGALDNRFLIMTLVSALVYLYASFLFLRRPTGEKTYRQTGIAILAVVLFQTSLNAVAEPKTTIFIFIFNWIFTWWVFGLYSDPKA